VDQTTALYMAKEAIGTVILIGGPLLGTSLIVGLLVSLFQSMTQIQEQTLTFIPKVAAIIIIMLILGPWMLSVMTAYTSNIFKQLASLGTM